MSYFTKGRHRKPTNTARNAAAVAVAGAIGTAGFVGTTSEALAGPPGGWGPIISCESGGNPTIQNATSTASGLFQFINGTWKAYGGTEFAPTAKQATVAEQYIVAERAYADAGTTPWNASKGCWAGKTGEATIKAQAQLKLPAPKKAAPAESAVERTQVLPVVVPATSKPTLGTDGNYEVKPGDTLSGIASAHDLPGGWKALAEKNPTVVEDAHWIFPGEKLNF